MAALKYSRQREAIKNYLAGRKDHPTADMVYTAIREVYPNISLGTVYRNLTLLQSRGKFQKYPAERTATVLIFGQIRIIILSVRNAAGWRIFRIWICMW